MMMKRGVLALVAGCVAAVPLAARAADTPWNMAYDYAQKLHSTNTVTVPKLSIDPKGLPAPETAQAPSGGPAYDPPVLTLDAGGSASRIHGFGDFRIATQYITPRGLVAEPSSPQFQAVVGLVFDVYHGDGAINDVSLLFGTWGDYNAHPDKSVVTGADVWTEQDFFAGVDVKFLEKWDLAYTIQAWTFPDLTSGHNEVDPTTEYNMDWKLSFDDTAYLKDFALHPYVDVFWNFAGNDSPVVAQSLLGQNDKTFYVELGIGPSYTLKAISDLPITFSFPTYFSVGDSSFWGETPGGDRSNLGVFSTGMKVSVPLAFIPKDFGSWNAYIGVTYFNTMNPALTFINSGTSPNNLVLGYGGVGFGF